jgi:hypothetical protein
MLNNLVHNFSLIEVSLQKYFTREIWREELLYGANERVCGRIIHNCVEVVYFI